MNLGNYLLHGRVEEAEVDHPGLEKCPRVWIDRQRGLCISPDLREARVHVAKLLGDFFPQFTEAYVPCRAGCRALDDAPGDQVLREALGDLLQTSTITKAEVERMLLHLLDPDANEEDLEDRELISVLYEDDLFEESVPNTDLDDDDELEPNIELDPEDYEDEEDPGFDMELDEDDILESALFADEYEDDEEEVDPKK